MGTMEGSGEEDSRSPVAAGEEKIFVSVRLRPLNEKEIFRRDVSDWECITDTTIIYKNHNVSVSERSMYPTAYTFDRVFRTDCSTRHVYEEGAKEVALSVVSGINSTVFAYGQTSSGKTYTMTGITEYTIADIYDYIQKHKEREFVVKFSALEIYNECVRDLLSADGAPLRLLDDPERGTIVEKLTEEVLRDWNHVIELLSICEAQRQNGETALNEASSRSHQIIRLTIESSTREFLGKDNSSTLTATVNFVDLAGSERASQSLSAGTRLKEGCHINRSLLTLGTVIRKLSKGKNGHIPFRDSKLTRILQSSLGGNARTAIICTMSPARCHVEQSRNTLLFASCAKEVTTNAQVNVVMSDKALVKHLQRELARLESELRSPVSSFSDYTTVILQKDHQIEQLEKEVKDLILQRDIAQSQVKDLLRLLRNDGNSLIQVGLGDYPSFRVHASPDNQVRIPDTTSIADSPAFSAQSRGSSDDNFIRIPDFEDNSQPNTPPRLLPGFSNFTESESYQAWEDIERRSNTTSEDLCKEVRCIETAESASSTQPEELKSNSPSPICYEDERTPESLSLPLEKERLPSQKEEKDSVLLILKEHEEQVPPPIKEEKQLLSASLNEEKELHCINSFNISANSSPPQDHREVASAPRNIMLSKSSSCNARLMIMQSSPLFDKNEKDENTPPHGSERVFVARPQGFSRKPSLLKFDSVVESLSNEDHHPSVGDTPDMELQAKTIDSPGNDHGRRSTAASTPERKELMELQQENEIPDIRTEQDDQKVIPCRKSVKDVGLDPIEDEVKPLTSWPCEFRRIQREIIDLWDSCHVSLVHRTYFYLLFQGDSTDAIYLQVELRRLVFLKDTFSRGGTTTINGKSISLASSVRAVRQERRMLSKQMLRKLTDEERDSLFLKWGIGINSKHRRLQLAHLLWSNTEDMNHVADSAYLVAKLMGFTDSKKQTPKAMFGLNFTPPPSSRAYSFKRSLASILQKRLLTEYSAKLFHSRILKKFRHMVNEDMHQDTLSLNSC